MAEPMKTTSICSVCNMLAGQDMIVAIGSLHESAATVGCDGCTFLFVSAQQVYFSLYGRRMADEQSIFVNYGILFPPKEFLILPTGAMGNVISQHGKIEVFKTLPRGMSLPEDSVSSNID